MLKDEGRDKLYKIKKKIAKRRGEEKEGTLNKNLIQCLRQGKQK